MLENAIYSVISPEGCASILWRDQAYAELAAKALRLTATDLLELGLIDQIVPEPEGGAHFDRRKMAESLDEYLVEALRSVQHLSDSERRLRRYTKFRAMGEVIEPGAGASAG
jgi:acetyl-CoA carboxylase carboxyl transferase subunit alpha